jgi:hypothetical protein
MRTISALTGAATNNMGAARTGRNRRFFALGKRVIKPFNLISQSS